MNKLPRFKTSLIVEVGEESGKFILQQELIYYSAILGRDITVPDEFKTDFASIPWILRWLFNVNGKHRKSATVHDYLCENGKEEGVTQAQADAVFREAMRTEKVNPIKRYAMYVGVRAYQITKGLLK